MTPEDITFYQEVRKRSQDPDVMRQIIHVAIRGLEDSANLLQKRAADMEVVASMAMNTRLFKGNENFLAQKLEKWQDQTSLRWDDQINKLKEKAK
jgi:hypothetical protein